MIEELQI